uniref:Uncharacterized protein n=1 Tax=Anguilla anguilla TaxID=7936 RepID=A0A0E9WAM8_ANGAN
MSTAYSFKSTIRNSVLLESLSSFHVSRSRDNNFSSV